MRLPIFASLLVGAMAQDPCDPCNKGGACAACVDCVNNKEGPCAPCWDSGCLPACEPCWPSGPTPAPAPTAPPGRSPTDGCSDEECTCHPDQSCSEGYPSAFSQCLDSVTCLGPVVSTNFQIMLPTEIVQTLLPKGLEPAPEAEVNGTHPLVFMFAQQHNIVKWNYLEYLLIVPSIQWNDEVWASNTYKYRGPFGYSAKLYLDDTGPTRAGQQHGVNKEQGQLAQVCDEAGSCTYTVRDMDGKPLLSATWQGHGAYVRGDEVPNFNQSVRPGFEVSAIGQYPVDEGVFQCFVTDWYFDTAVVQAATGSFTVHSSFIGELPTGTWSVTESILDSAAGAYRMETMWWFEQPASPDKETCSAWLPPDPSDPCFACNPGGVCAACKPCVNITTGKCAACWAVTDGDSCLPSCQEQCWTPPAPTPAPAPAPAAMDRTTMVEIVAGSAGGALLLVAALCFCCCKMRSKETLLQEDDSDYRQIY